MDYPPSSSSPTSPELSKKAWILSVVRKVLLAIIIAVAITAVGWFIYDHFFRTADEDGAYRATKEGIANTIRENSEPVPDAVRMQIAESMRRNAATSSVSKDGQVQNSTPASQREMMLQRISGQPQ